MAYDFIPTDKITYSSSAVSDGGTFSGAFWFNWDAGTGYAFNRWASSQGWILRIESGTTPGKINYIMNGGTPSSHSINSLSAGTWQHCTFTAIPGSTHALYLDGDAGSTMSGTITTSSVALHLGDRQVGSRPFDGRVAEVAWWNGVALTAGEAASLADGLSPLFVRPDALEFYAPLIRDTGDIIGGNAATLSGSPPVADHPRIITPGQIFYSIPPVAAGIDQTVSPAAVTFTAQTAGFALTIDQTVSPASIPFTGQSVSFGLTVDQTVAPASVPFVGQAVGFSLGFDFNQTVTPASVPFVGQTLAFDLTHDYTVTPGPIILTGQAVGFALTVDQTVSPASIPFVGQAVDLTFNLTQCVGPATVTFTPQPITQLFLASQTVNPATVTMTGQQVGFMLPLPGEGTLLAIIEEDLGETFFDCTGTGFAVNFTHMGTTYCGIFTAEATDIAERKNPFLEVETSITTGMSRGDAIVVASSALTPGGSFTIRGLSPDGTGQSMIVMDLP